MQGWTLSFALRLVPWLFTTAALAQPAAPVMGNPATAATKAANAAVLRALPFADKTDFEDAQRGLIAKPDTLTIEDANGRVVWDLDARLKQLEIEALEEGDERQIVLRAVQRRRRCDLRQTHLVYEVRSISATPTRRADATFRACPSARFRRDRRN